MKRLACLLLIGMAAPANAAQAVPAKKVFVTSERYTANLGGLTGADAKCQVLATKAHLRGNFKAWLSDYTASPSTRFTHSKGPYRLTNGTTIAKNWTDLTDGSIAAPIDVTETKFQFPGTITPNPSVKMVFTGTDIHGLLYRLTAFPDADVTCSSWTNSGPSDWPAATAEYNATSLDPLSGYGCAGLTARLFCFQQ